MGKKSDKELGMERPISRRDLLHGFGALTAASFVPGCQFADEIIASENAQIRNYPPARTGMRGNHDGSFEVAHQLAREGKRDWGMAANADGTVYDLVVVGAGISGLSAAHFYLKDNPKARILLLDNHDDFGGHAKRNEFQLGDRTILSYGGSQSLVSPESYPEHTSRLIQDLGIDVDTLENAYDQDFYKRHDLSACIHFNNKNWGVDRVVPYELGGMTYLPLAASSLSAADAVAMMPISDAAKREFLHVLTERNDQIGMSAEQKDEYVYSISYRNFLERHLGVTEPEVFAILQDQTLDIGAGIEAVSAGDAFYYNGLPGAAAAGLTVEADDPYIHHFPDGNASIARMLVRKMIPGVATGSTFEDVVGERFNYDALDDASSAVRLRLNSTAINVQHEGNPENAQRVSIDYVYDGKAHQVRAKHCVLACYNAIIPSLCPNLPEEQRQALAMPEKSPILYTSVLLSNWRAWKELGIGAAISSGSYHPVAMLDFPVTFGGHEFPDDPNDPMIVHMERFPHRANEGLTAREQKRLGRYELLATSFETMELNIRQQLASLLSAGDFDPARDIAGITVNRWAHGYTDGFWDLNDPWLGDRNDERQPHVRGRQAFGRITIANSDAGGSAMLESAVQQAHRAIEELNQK